MTTPLIVSALCLLLLGTIVAVRAARAARARHWVGGTVRGLRRAGADRARRAGGYGDGGPPGLPCPHLRGSGGHRAHRARGAPAFPCHDHPARPPPSTVR